MPDSGLVWLANLAMGLSVMGDPVLHEFEAKLQFFDTMWVAGNEYEIFLTSGGTAWVANDEYTLYVCRLGDRYGVAKVSARYSAEDRSVQLPSAVIMANAKSLRHEAEMLQMLRHESIALDESCAKGDEYFHHSFFPEVLATEELDDGGYVEILGYPKFIRSLAQLEPASSILARNVRTGLEAAWILGKNLKILSFIHQRDFVNGYMDAENILLATGKHLPIIFDWRFSRVSFSSSQKAQEIMQAVQLYVDLVGGQFEGGHVTLPFDGDVMTEAQNAQFAAYFERILSGNCGSAYEEWARFYEIAHAVWPKYRNDQGQMQHPFHKFRQIDLKKAGM